MPSLPRRLLLRLEGAFPQQGAWGWSKELPPGLEDLTDNDAAPSRSPLIVLEDNRPLGAGHDLHQAILDEGGGRYSFWKGSLLFSTSDNSNPNTNSREYTVWLTDGDVWDRAQRFVGNLGESYYMNGILQFELLKRNGLQRHHHVLEIGCGAMSAGRLLLSHLEPDCYVGIEPNLWLVQAARHRFPDMAELFVSRRPVFLARTDFDASETGRHFDFILSHSVLSHAAHTQLGPFLRACKKVLRPHGMAVASIRFRDERGVRVGDSMHAEWQYPGVSYFSFETVARSAEAEGLEIEERQDYREFYMHYLPSNHHDWIRLWAAAPGGTAQRPPPLYDEVGATPSA